MPHLSFSSDGSDRWAFEVFCSQYASYQHVPSFFPLKMRRQYITLDLQIHLKFTGSVPSYEKGDIYLLLPRLAAPRHFSDSKQVYYLMMLTVVSYANIILCSPPKYLLFPVPFLGVTTASHPPPSHQV